MADVKRIKNLKLAKTEEQRKNALTEVKSVRNRLLANSDWVFLPDINLEEQSLANWIEWRRKVRRSDEFDEPNEGMKYLDKLAQEQPFTKYKTKDHASVQHYKVSLYKFLNKTIKKVIDGLYEDSDCRELISERFEEALRYKEGKTENNFLLKIEAEHSNSTMEEVVERTLKAREHYLTKLITIENEKNRVIKCIDNVASIEECDTIHEEITILGIKKWI